MLKSLFGRDTVHETATALFSTASEQARLPAFYLDLGVEDSLEGRFEMLALHVYLILRRLKGHGAAPEKVAQGLFDAMFAHLDDGLREMGVGDLVVGKRIRRLAENFYGRVAAYEAALSPDSETDALPATLSRNVYAADGAPSAVPLARYVRQAAAELSAQPVGRIASGVVVFPALQKTAADNA
jgi:cytochrome b pre-mRNA-processing protein 3